MFSPFRGYMRLPCLDEHGYDRNNNSDNDQNRDDVEHRVNGICVRDSSNLVAGYDRDEYGNRDDDHNDDCNHRSREGFNIHMYLSFLFCHGD